MFIDFSFDASPGASKAGHKLAIPGGTPQWPLAAHNAALCGASTWPSWDGYGTDLFPVGSGSTRLNCGSPLAGGDLDDAVQFDLAKDWRSYDCDVDVEDFAVEALVRTPPKQTGNGYILRKGAILPGWNVTVEDAPADPYGWVGKRIRATFGTASTQITVVSETLWYDTWYHIMVCAERNGYLDLFINGTRHAHVYAGSLDNVSISTVHGFVIGECKCQLAFARFWYGANLIGSDPTSTVKQRFYLMCGMDGRVSGVWAEPTFSRDSIAWLQSKNGDLIQEHKVGIGWP